MVFFECFFGKSVKLAVKLFGYFAPYNGAVKILFNHSGGTAYKVAECVCKVGIKHIYKAFVGDGAVVKIGHLRKQIVAHRINTKTGGKLVGVDNITL